MIRDDLLDMKKEIKEMKEQSFAMELLHDARKSNKRMFIIIIVILAMFTALLGYTLWLLNDIGTVEDTTVTQENENGYNNFIGNNGDINYGKAKD